MTINQLNTAGALSASSSSLSNVRKVSLPNVGTVPPSTSTTEPKLNSRPESEEQIKEAVQKIQGSADNSAHNLKFSIDEDTGKTIVRVMDAHTDEIIRQIPSKEAIEIARTLDKAQGLLFNGKA